jgi:hypothetical protein
MSGFVLDKGAQHTLGTEIFPAIQTELDSIMKIFDTSGRSTTQNIIDKLLHDEFHIEFIPEGDMETGQNLPLSVSWQGLFTPRANVDDDKDSGYLKEPWKFSSPDTVRVRSEAPYFNLNNPQYEWDLKNKGYYDYDIDQLKRNQEIQTKIQGTTLIHELIHGAGNPYGSYQKHKGVIPGERDFYYDSKTGKNLFNQFSLGVDSPPSYYEGPKHPAAWFGYDRWDNYEGTQHHYHDVMDYLWKILEDKNLLKTLTSTIPSFEDQLKLKQESELLEQIEDIK